MDTPPLDPAIGNTDARPTMEEAGRNLAKFGFGLWALGGVTSAFRLLGDHAAERERIRAKARHLGIPEDVIASVEMGVDREHRESLTDFDRNDVILRRLWEML